MAPRLEGRLGTCTKSLRQSWEIGVEKKKNQYRKYIAVTQACIINYTGENNKKGGGGGGKGEIKKALKN